MAGDPFAHVVFVGIIVQGASALLLALLFFALRRLARHRAYLLDWSVAYAGLAVAIAALFVRYLASEGFRPGGGDFANVGHPLTQTLYLIYQAGKLTFFAGLATGAARFAGRSLPIRAGWLGALILAGAVASVVVHDALVPILVWQAPAAVLSSAAAALLLFRIPRERRSFGSMLTASTCLLLIPLWAAYAWGFGGSPSPDHAPGRALIALCGHNSFVDVVIQSVLGLGMVIALFQDLEREGDAARAERAQLQARLEESRRLEALGVVVSGVAHELNNPLTAILGFSEELAAESDRGEEIDSAVQVIHEQALRCRSIVRDLLTFARPRPPVREPVAIAALVDRVVRGFAPALRRAGVRIEVGVASDLPPIQAEGAALEQMLANLVDNAIDASRPGGIIAVAARGRDDGCELVVEDEGAGIPAPLAERVFEPFFTTKVPGQGTGLGLAVSHRIVASHGGTIGIEARADGRSGARFVVHLPAHATDARPAEPGAARAAAPRARPGPAAASGLTPRILVVDDEATVRALLRRRLEQHGWIVVEASDGADALERVRRAESPFDAVILDLKMRGVSGYALHEQLGQEAPGLARRTVAITGDVLAPDVARFAAASGCEVLEKPLDLDRLMGRVAALCGREIGRSVAGRA